MSRADPADHRRLAVPGARGVSNWNVANGLTAVRFALVPLVGWLLFAGDGHPGWRVAAVVVFVTAIITDRFDGELARRRGLVTDVGKIADPIADKALIGTALVGLSLLGELSWWATGVVLAREMLVTGLRFVVIRRAVLPAGRGGKVKTALQAVAITLYLTPLPVWAQPVAVTAMALAVIVTVGTGLDYVVKLVRIMRGGKASGVNDRA